MCRPRSLSVPWRRAGRPGRRPVRRIATAQTAEDAVISAAADGSRWLQSPMAFLRPGGRPAEGPPQTTPFASLLDLGPAAAGGSAQALVTPAPDRPIHSRKTCCCCRPWPGCARMLERPGRELLAATPLPAATGWRRLSLALCVNAHRRPAALARAASGPAMP